METTPQALWREKEAAVKLRGEYLSLYTDRLTKWCGNRYRKGWTTKPQLENYEAEYIHFVVPQLVNASPTLTISPAKDARDTANAEGQQGILNHFVRCYDYKRQVIEPMALAVLLGWGVTYRYLDLSLPDIPVVSKTIPIGDYFCDSQAYGWQARRIEGHTAERSKAELLADPLYEQAWPIIADLKGNTEQAKRDDLPTQKSTDGPSRSDMVTLVHFYVRATGEVITLADSGGSAGVELRREQYDGPKEGPYQLWGTWEVPGQIYPLPILAASEEQQDDLNDHANAASKSARSYKRFAVGQKGSADDLKTAQTVKHGQMVLFSAPGSVTEVEMGGMTDIQAKTLDILRDRVDRNLGFSDAQRGQASGKATLGENELAQANADWRIRWIQDRLIGMIEADLKAVGWFFFNKDQIVTDMVVEDPTGQKRTKRFFGGQFGEDDVQGAVDAGLADPAAMYGIGRTWDDYDLKIDAESMVRVADAVRQKRAQDEMSMAFNLYDRLSLAVGPVMALQCLNMKRLFRRYGNAYNESQYELIMFTPLFDRVCSPDFLAAGMMPGMQQPGMMGGGAPVAMAGQPTLGAGAGMAPQPGMAQLPPGQTSPAGVRQSVAAGVAA